MTAKSEPGDVDVFMLMEADFDFDRLSREQRSVFNHMAAHNYEGASVFWMSRAVLLDSERALVEHWQLTRDDTQRGIVEVIDHDQK